MIENQDLAFNGNTYFLIYIFKEQIPQAYKFSLHYNFKNQTQHGRRRIITFEFGKHNDKYFGNLEGHGSPNLLKMKLYISGFWRK